MGWVAKATPPLLSLLLLSLLKVKVKFTLDEVTKAQRGSRGIDTLFL
jgi:hypothetical protein